MPDDAMSLPSNSAAGGGGGSDPPNIGINSDSIEGEGVPLPDDVAGDAEGAGDDGYACGPCGAGDDDVVLLPGQSQRPKHKHCSCAKNCPSLFTAEADQSRIESGKLNYNALSTHDRRAYRFNVVREACKDPVTGTIPQRVPWSFMRRHVCLDFFAFGHGFSKTEVMHNKDLLQNGHLCAPRPLGQRMPSLNHDKELNRASAWWAHMYAHMAEPMPTPETEESLPVHHETRISPEHPLILAGMFQRHPFFCDVTSQMGYD